jgi:hypothetical protein
VSSSHGGCEMHAGGGGMGRDEVRGSALEDDPATVVVGAGIKAAHSLGHLPYATHRDDYAATVLASISRGPMF